ncbi:MAG: succinate--CoA ligase subunit alpha [Firmicutes bacterium]|nr:succinate--CoA ligase subunit alpha [Bacillota bacterium]
MAILLNKNTKVIVQGITGSHGNFHASQMLSYGTKVVGGVTPGKSGQETLGVPIFDTVLEAKRVTKATVSCIFVPPAFAADAILEAADAGMDLVVCITEGIPVIDMMRVNSYLAGKKTKLIGPNCPGLITPDEAKVGILPGMIHKKGKIGVVSRSGTLTYEAVNQLSIRGIGQSSAVGIGGDPIKGLGFVDILELFNKDKDTLAVVLIGEIGGSGEEDAAEYIKTKMKKPVAAFIGGATAPEGKRMGHAGAIIMGGKGTAEGKKKVLRDAGVFVAETPDKIGDALVEAIKKAGIYEECLIK